MWKYFTPCLSSRSRGYFPNLNGGLRSLGSLCKGTTSFPNSPKPAGIKKISGRTDGADLGSPIEGGEDVRHAWIAEEKWGRDAGDVYKVRRWVVGAGGKGGAGQLRERRCILALLSGVGNLDSVLKRAKLEKEILTFGDGANFYDLILDYTYMNPLFLLHCVGLKCEKCQVFLSSVVFFCHLQPDKSRLHQTLRETL